MRNYRRTTDLESVLLDILEGYMTKTGETEYDEEQVNG